MNFRFESFQALHLLWLLVAFIPLVIFFSQRQQKRIKLLFGKSLPSLIKTLSVRKQNIKWILECLVFTLLVMAYARPQFEGTAEKIQRSGIEIIFAIDVSLSMLAEDIKPNRLDLAQKTLKRILDKLAGHRAGLVAFAGSAVLISPLTSDYSTLAMYIDAISTSLMSTQGTQFAPALNIAASSFEQEDTGPKTKHTSRVIIIISDGEDNEEGALETARTLADMGLHIYTIAVGMDKPVPIPMKDQFGQFIGYKKDKATNIVLSQVQDKLLQQLASVGQGHFTYASFQGDEVELLVDALNQLEQREFEEEQIVNYQEQFQILSAIALLLMFIELLLSEKNPSKNKAK